MKIVVTFYAHARTDPATIIDAIGQAIGQLATLEPALLPIMFNAVQVGEVVVSGE